METVMENIKEIIAKNLVELRKSRRLTQQELAEKINYSDKAVSRWEHAETLPDIETLCKICDIYGVKFEYLLQKEQAPRNKNPYIVQRTMGNKIAISLIALVSVWLIATVVFVYASIFMNDNAWQVFIWAIPVSSIVCQCCNRFWGNRRLSYIFVSITVWTLILSIYVALIHINAWLLFIIGVPIQIIIVLSASIKNTRNK